MTVSCHYCEKEFSKPESHVRRVSKVFCSNKCHSSFRSRKVKKACEICRTVFEVFRSTSHRYSTCPKKRCRDRKKKRERNPNWRGWRVSRSRAARSTVKYKAWRKAVFERDDYTCQMKECGRRGGDLEADHIKPWAYFPKLRYVVSNGRTLCLKCHRTTFKEVFKWRGCV